MTAAPGDTKIMTTYSNRGVDFHHRALKQWLDFFHATPVVDKLDSEVRMGIWINSRIQIPVPTLHCVNNFFCFCWLTNLWGSIPLLYHGLVRLLLRKFAVGRSSSYLVMNCTSILWRLAEFTWNWSSSQQSKPIKIAGTKGWDVKQSRGCCVDCRRKSCIDHNDSSWEQCVHLKFSLVPNKD